MRRSEGHQWQNPQWAKTGRMSGQAPEKQQACTLSQDAVPLQQALCSTSITRQEFVDGARDDLSFFFMNHVSNGAFYPYGTSQGLK